MASNFRTKKKNLVYTLKSCVYNITSTPKDFGICIIIICRCSFLQYVTYRSYLTGTNEEIPQKAQKEELLHRAKKSATKLWNGKMKIILF